MKTIKKYTSANSTSSGNSVSQSTGSNEPKGSQSNPYSYSEYSSIPEDQWTGGYVEGLGYVLATVEVYGSTSDSSDAFSDMFSDPFSNPFSDMFSDMSSFWDTSESGGGSGGGHHNGNNNGGGNGGGHGSGNPITKYQQQLNRLYAKMPQSLKNAVDHLNVKFEFDSSLKDPAIYYRPSRTVRIKPSSLSESTLFHELVHVWQHDNGIMDSISNHSNIEFETYVITDIFDAYNKRFGGSFTVTEEYYNSYINLIFYCTHEGNKSEIFLYDTFVESILDYFEPFRIMHQGSRAGDAPDPNYQWNWHRYLSIYLNY